jgi:hypothetical protein
MAAKRAELLCGLGALVGIAGLVAVLYAPVYPTVIDGTPGFVTSLAGPFGDPRVLPPSILTPIVVGGALVILVSVGAAVHSRRGAPWAAQLVLWAATAGFLVEMLAVDLPFFRVFLLPALALALVSSGLAICVGGGSRVAPV